MARALWRQLLVGVGMGVAACSGGDDPQAPVEPALGDNGGGGLAVAGTCSGGTAVMCPNTSCGYACYNNGSYTYGPASCMNYSGSACGPSTHTLFQ